VLVVDDNDDVRVAFATLLRVAGYAVASAWSAEDALRQLRQGLEPSLIVLDIHMPGMEGWELATELARNPGPSAYPVVVISGDAGQRAIAEARGVAFLQKPVDGGVLVEAVARYCTRRHS
jgi:CheY-like chemotaxis protein